MTPWFLTDKSKPVPLVRVTVSEVSKTQRQTFREIPPDPTKITLTFSQLYPRNAAPWPLARQFLAVNKKHAPYDASGIGFATARCTSPNRA